MSLFTFKNVAIIGLDRDCAPEELSSDSVAIFLEKTLNRLKLPLKILEELTGIKSRRLYPYHEKSSEIAARAAEKLFQKINFDRKLIDLLYSTSVCRDYIEPSTASTVGFRLGVGPEVKALDLGSACLGFMDGMELAALQIDQGLAQHALVVAGENSRPNLMTTIKKLVEPNIDRAMFFRNFASLTLGSGGAAMLLGRADLYPEAPRLISSVSLSDFSANHLCRGDHQGMETDSAALMISGVALAGRAFQLATEKLGWSVRDYFKSLVCHQVSETNSRKFCQTLGFDFELMVKSYPQYGNMGPVAVPFTLDLALEQGLINKGQRVALMGIGSGLCSTMMEVIL